jgi:elongation factor Ts
MEIKPALVKELRERTGAGMMDCKKALVEAQGDMDQAVELLRKSGQAKADKKSARVAAEGTVVVRSNGARHAIIEVNSETDFVAKDDNFRRFAERAADVAVARAPADVAALMTQPADAGTLEDQRLELVTKVGENIGVRRFELVESTNTVGNYVHMGRIGVLVELEGGDDALARDLAMQVAAAVPRYIEPNEVPKDVLDKEREIFSAQAAQEGKPPQIVEKMVEGRLRKFVDEITLLGQPFVKNPDQRVRDLLKERKARVLRFVRFEVGEGIDKQKGDFAKEVASLSSPR